MSGRRVRAALVAVGVAALASPRALAWVHVDPAGPCGQYHWDETTIPRIEIRWANNSVGGDFSAAEKQLIRDSLAALNSLPNARVYFWEGTTPCVGEQAQNGGAPQPDDTVCVRKTGTCAAGPPCGQASVVGVGVPGQPGACHVRWAEVEFSGPFTGFVDAWYAMVQHEFSHALGLSHTLNELDWMDDGINAPLGGTLNHSGMTRDHMNGLSFKQAFGPSFLLGHFSETGGSGSRADLLTRDSKAASDTVPWYQAYRLDGSWLASSYSIADLGNQNTLAVLAGDFTGDGCEDVARGHCSGCNPGDGVPDTIQWGVQPSTCTGSWQTFSTWHSDFGNGEDYDQYRVGDFDGDGCDDIWLLRNESSRTCNGNLTDPNDPNACAVSFWWLLARSADGSAYPPCDRFVLHGTTQKMVITDRSAASAWPWVVGNFYTADGRTCADIAWGEPSQSDPRVVPWRVAAAVDSNSNALCDALWPAGTWLADWGELGALQYFAGDAGNGAADDLVQVQLPVGTAQTARWSVAYSNGSSAFTGVHTPVVQDISGAARWHARVFGVANLDGAAGVDLLSLSGMNATGSVRYDVFFDGTGTGAWLQAGTESGIIPTSQSTWDQPTDADDSTVLDNAGEDLKGPWWCETCNLWHNQCVGGVCDLPGS